MVTRSARAIFSCYRRDDFADAEGFLLQLGTVFDRYPAEVVEAVSSPLTGIQRRAKFPPTIAEIVEACEAEAARLARIAELGKRKTGPRQPRPSIESFANVFVPSTSPAYADLVERTKGADPRDWRVEEGRSGIWVALDWLTGEGSTWRTAKSRSYRTI